MAFSSEEEQLRKFRNDEIAQHYFEVLRTLISKKSIFAQNIGLYDVAAYLGEIFSGVGAEGIMISKIQKTFSRNNSFNPRPVSPSSSRGAIGTFAKTKAFPIGMTAQIIANIFQLSIPAA